MAIRLAWRNFTRDRVRLIVAVTGVSFAVMLMAVQVGLLIGFASTSSSLIDRAPADFWIVPRGTKDVDQASDMPQRWKYLVAGLPGVRGVDVLGVRFAFWKRPEGGTESVIVVGIDPYRPALLPWNLVAGAAESLRHPDGIIVDRLYAAKLGIARPGDLAEVGNHRARLVGMTAGVRTFTQSPYVFASLKTAHALTDLPEDRVSYLLVKADRGVALEGLGQALQAMLPSCDVWTAAAFSWRTRIYWMLTTGAGAGLLLAAVLGLIVGLVIVSQTLYSATVERVQEYTTIRAMGATDWYLKAIILRQSVLIGALGYGLGISGAAVIVAVAANSSAALMLPWQLVLVLAAVTLGMCVAASLISMRKVLTLDPASVFK